MGNFNDLIRIKLQPTIQSGVLNLLPSGAVQPLGALFQFQYRKPCLLQQSQNRILITKDLLCEWSPILLILKLALYKHVY